MKLKLGVVGIPADWQRRYLPSLRVLADRFDVISVYSSVARIADNAARQFDATPYTSFREMLASNELDAALILTNDWYGLAPIYAACDFGKAVYCGSEFEFRSENVSQLSQRVDEAGIAFMAEFPRRYAPASLRLKELIATQLGHPELMFCHRRMENAEASSQRSRVEREQREKIELIDWCQFIAGRKPSRVQSVQHALGQTADHVSSFQESLPQDQGSHGTSNVGNPSGGASYESFSLHFDATEDGRPPVLAQVSCGDYIDPAWQEAVSFRPPASLQVCCTNGVAFVDLPNGITWFDRAGRHQESLDSETGVGQQLLSQFHRAVTSLIRKMGDLDDVRQSLAIISAARESTVRACAVDL